MALKDKFNIMQFSGKDFKNWSFRVKSVLRAEEIEDAVTQKDYHVKNKKREGRAQAIIIAAVADTHLEYVRNKESAYQMFECLEATFSKRGTRSQLFLRRNISKSKFNEKLYTLQEHFGNMESYFSELEDTGAKIDEAERINYILMSMPDTYDNVITALDTVEELTLPFVKNRLLGEEEKRKNKDKPENSSSSVAFNCFLCGSPNHKRAQCKFYWQNQNKNSYSPRNTHFNVRSGYNGRGNFTGRSGYGQNERGSFTGRGGYHQWEKGGNSNKQNSNCSGGYRGRYNFYKTSHNQINKDADGKLDKGHDNISFYTNSDKDLDNSDVLEWCLDSGSSNHLVVSDRFFSKYIVLNEPKNIAVAKDGVSIVAKGIGTIDVILEDGTECNIKNVYHVPELRQNLLSVSKMEESGLKIIFSNSEVQIYNDELLCTGFKSGSLFKLRTAVNLNNCFMADGNNLKLWHKRTGHLGYENLKLLLNGTLTEDPPKLNYKEKETCESCILAKITRLPFKKKGYRARNPLELVHTDICGPISPSTWDDRKYFITFIDDKTHFTAVYLLKQKSEALDYFKIYHNMATNHFNRPLKRLRSDNGGEYISSDFKNFCLEKGIDMQYTVAYNPELNGVAERMNRTLVEKVRTMILDSNLSKELWGEALYTATYITNRSPTKCLEVTPYELWEGRKPNLKNLRVMGCTAYAHIPKEFRQKLDPKGKKLIMAGYSPSGYRLWDKNRRKIVIARNVIFNEESFEEKNLNEDMPFVEEIQEINQHESSENKNVQTESMKEELESRGKRIKRKPKKFEDFDMDINSDEELYLALQTYEVEDVPVKFADVEERKDKEQWYDAIRQELDVLKLNNTWTVVPTPPGEKLVESKWVFTKKRSNDKNSICKARLVARGFQQKERFESSDIYAPVAKLQTLRVLLSVTAQKNLHLHQMDVKGAFLHGDIHETVYMKPPDGIKIKDGTVLKLNKSIYGLKKSPKYWNEKFDDTIKRYGFIRSNNDYCLYMKKSLYVLVFVDDLIIAGADLDEINWLKRRLSEDFKMKDVGSENLNYLGIRIKKYGDYLEVDQIEYLNSILCKYNMENCKSVSTPMDVNFKIDINEPIKPELENKCRSLIGSLLYATIGTRPDLASSVYYLSRFQTKPSDALWQALKRILRYIKGSINLKLKYNRSINSIVPLQGYADSDWAGSHDRHSTAGYIFKVFNNTVSWCSKKQATVALSSTEAEFISLSYAACEACWLKKLLEDFNISVGTVTLFEDNQGAIHSAKSPDVKRLKHLDIKYNFIKEKIEEKIINLEYVPTNEQLADVLTKPLSKVKFLYFLDKMDLKC